MEGLSTNEALAVEVVERLLKSGVRTFCLCPGGRNAPLVEVLERLTSDRGEVLPFFDERSAAFFALGRARRCRAPAAVLTTSGTAAAELLPAIIEAHYSGDPLIGVTADRPRACRGTGAPQAIEQPGLFGTYVHQSIDLDQPGEPWSLDPIDGPIHVNVCFDEPLLDKWRGAVPHPEKKAVAPPGPSPAPAPLEAAVAEFLACHRRPLVVLGALRGTDVEDVSQFCGRLGAPVLAEACSHLSSKLGQIALQAGDTSARRAMQMNLFDAVVRIGDVPSFRLWRDLEGTRRLPVLSVSRRPWPGLTHGTHLQAPSQAQLPLAAVSIGSDWQPPADEELFRLDRQLAKTLDRLLDEYPDSEPAIFRRLSTAIPPGAFVYLGNSLPIREWNQFSIREDRGFSFGANRGANGIDGQISTFLGSAAAGAENWAIVGDLTALYDLSSLWALRHGDGLIRRIVVINNGGGRIFERLFRNPRFQNAHAIRFDSWASLWDVEYHRHVPERWTRPVGIVEWTPDSAQTSEFWRRVDADGTT